MKSQNPFRNETKSPDTETVSKSFGKGRAEREPLAITGIGCRFPGCDGPEAFWELMRDGLDAIREMPAGRFDMDAVYDPTPGRPGRLVTRLGGFLENVDQFDASFFGVSPREAARMDPQQRLLMEVAWEALEDAGLVADSLAGSPTGVFIGACTSDYEDIQYYLKDREGIDLHVSTGTARSVLSGRLSYLFDLRGPSMTIDTACSSSLVAVHLACQSLWRGECGLALAGGTNLVLLPEMSMSFSRSKMLSPDGRCKFGDAAANGFIRSDGIGVVVLKPLSRAQADSDPIYAIIRGSAVGNDGRSSGLLATPGRDGQENVLRAAYRDANVSAGDIDYVEAHGTGTSVGDPVEIQSLGAVLAEGRPDDRPCAIGSVKTNIGHTEGAAGIAGLIKTAICLNRKAIPPSLHHKEPNPDIPWQDLPLAVQRGLTTWPSSSRPALAAVSAFGISGTNAHVVLEESSAATLSLETLPDDMTGAQLLTLSAASAQSLETLARRYLSLADAGDARPSLRDACYTASLRRIHHDHRLALVARSWEEASGHLDAFLNGESRLEMSFGRKLSGAQRKPVFVFSGQGSQQVGMGRELMEREPVFRAALERCDLAMRSHVDWSLFEELAAEESRSRLDEIDVIQPCLFAIQVSLAALWRHWGIEPKAVVGLSMGEVAAVCAAGALSLEDGARVICRRSRLLKRLSGQGRMAVVALSLEEAGEVLAGYEGRLAIAVSNSSNSTVISGDPKALEEVMGRLEAEDIFCRLIKVDVASHSPQVDCLQSDLLEELAGLEPRRPDIPIYSTVTAKPGYEAFDAAYWMRNLREPVLFSTALESLIEDGHDTFLEISPHPLMLSAINQAIQNRGAQAATLPSLRHDEGERTAMLGSLGSLYALGCSVKWNNLHEAGGNCVRLPSYPWQRERHWLGAESREVRRNLAARPARGESLNHPHLSEYFYSAAHSGAYIWEFYLGTDLFPFLKDHRVHKKAVLPAASYLEMALAAASALFGDEPRTLEKVAFKKALFLFEGKPQRVQLVMSVDMPEKASFKFFSVDERQKSSELHAEGVIRLGKSGHAATRCSPDQVQAQCAEYISGAQHYEDMSERGIEYGLCFQGVKNLWRQSGEAIAQLELSESLEPEAALYKIHPALLDSCFQTLAATLSADVERVAETETYLPVGLDSLRLYDRPQAEVFSHAILLKNEEASPALLKGDVFLLDADGRVLLEALGLSMQRLSQRSRMLQGHSLDDWLYEIRWRRVEPNRESVRIPQSEPGTWLIFADRSGVSCALANFLMESGQECVLVSPGDSFRALEPGHFQINPNRPEDFIRLLEAVLNADVPLLRGIAYLWSLDGETDEEKITIEALEKALALVCGSVLHLAQALSQLSLSPSPRLWLVTAGVQDAGTQDRPVSLAQSPLWGLGKALRHEHPDLRCALVDLSPAPDTTEAQSLAVELLSDDCEDQIALRGEECYVARLEKSSPQECRATAHGPAHSHKRTIFAGEMAFRLKAPSPGIIEDLSFRETSRPKPGPGEVEIQVYAIGLNFRDVMLSLGILPTPEGIPADFGWECAGRIVATGEGVEDFKPGDEVLAIAPPCFGSFAKAPASLVFPKPDNMSFEEAATIPIAFLTAYYALHHLARIQPGERVLIQAASGGVGLAAAQLARRAGAEIFATAGSPEKRAFLRSIGVERVFDSRSLAFADEVMKATGGEGVDIVLNSLSGEFIPASLSLLRAGGRFLELGRRDIHENMQLGLGPFQNNLSFSAIDIDLLIRQKPALMGSLLGEALRGIEDGSLSLLTFESLPISDVRKAFRQMAQARHMGKIVLTVQDQKLEVDREGATTFRSDGTYLISGGLGALGLSVAQWMVSRGARHLVLMGRSHASLDARKAIKEMKEAGAAVVVARADVGDESQVARVIAGLGANRPPLIGVMHAAAVLDDGILIESNMESFERVMRPKINGAWNLHRLTADAALDFFVLFSSAASLLGSPGQGNYSAANSFLDALAHYRRMRGLPALSINWGPWSETGLAARPERGGRLARRGLGSIAPEQGLQALGRLFEREQPQIAVMPFDLRRWEQFYPSARRSPFFSELSAKPQSVEPVNTTAKQSKRLSRDSLLAAKTEERLPLLESYLSRQIARVLGIPESRLSGLDVNQPINRMGIDSLMAVEIKTIIEADLGLVIPIKIFLQGASLAQLSTQALDQLTEARQVAATTPVASLKAAVMPGNFMQWHVTQPAPADYTLAAGPANDCWEELCL